MKKIRELKVDGDNYNIIRRSDELVKKWYKMVQPNPSRHEYHEKHDQYEQEHEQRDTPPSIIPTIDVTPAELIQQQQGNAGNVTTPIETIQQQGGEANPMEIIEQVTGGKTNITIEMRQGDNDNKTSIDEAQTDENGIIKAAIPIPVDETQGLNQIK